MMQIESDGMSQSTSRGRLSAGGVLLSYAVGILTLLSASCTWVAVNADAIQGDYICQISGSGTDSAWEGARIVLRDGVGTLVTSARVQELTYTISDQSSPWIAVLLDDGTSMHLQYRRPGQLSYYDPFGGRADFVRVGK
jgi:hypothetical protein